MFEKTRPRRAAAWAASVAYFFPARANWPRSTFTKRAPLRSSATIPANSREHGLVKKTGEAARSLHLDAIWAGEKEEKHPAYAVDDASMKHTGIIDHLLVDHYAWS